MNITPMPMGEGAMFGGQRLQVWPLPWATTTYQVGEVYEIPAGPRLFVARCVECDPERRLFLFDVLQVMEVPVGWRAKH
jgi:hypothetical protein